MLNASPASARPIDCSLTVTLINAGSSGLNGKASVYCSKPEHLTVYINIYREDALGHGATVASGKGDSNGRQGWTYATANEPCSQLQTTKKYHAVARVDDTTYHIPIEVKDAQTPSYKGHC